MKFCLGLILISLLFFSCKSNESVLLRLKSEPGDERIYAITVKLNCGTTAKVYTYLKTKMILDSVSHSKDLYFTSTITAIKTDINLNGMLLGGSSEHYDSTKPRRNMDYNEIALAQKYDSIMVKYYQLAYNERGEVVRPFTVRGESVMAPFAAGVIQPQFPQQKVKVGDHWTVQLTGALASGAAQFVQGNTTFEYRVKDITADKVLLDVNLLYQSNGGISNGRSMESKGVFTINRKNGQLLDGYFPLPASSCEDAIISVTRED